MIVNPHNNDEKCFKWLVITAENTGMKDPQRVSKLRKFMDNYDWSRLEFPVSNKDIGKFETRNNISVNVLGVEGRDIYIHRKGWRKGRENNLLMVSEDCIWHYTAIMSLSRLLSSKNSNTKCKQHFCMNCLQGFTQELSRDQHQAKNKEDYISFSIKVPVDSYIDKNGEEKDKLIELRFIDSFKFMSSSLDSLTKNLVRGGKKLFGFEDYSELQYDLLTRKGVYPYEYVNSWDRFNETQLPPIDAFYSNLNTSLISEDDYQHAQRVWEEFGIHNLGDYHDLYLRTDLVLLASVYKAFRDTCLKHYKLDPVHFYTSPGLA